MSNKCLGFNMKITAASYLPDSQVITLKPVFQAFCDPENVRGFHGASEIGFFFHEWIHFLHNVSTIHGFSIFANLIHLRSAFRHTIGGDGLSAGSVSLNTEHKINAQNFLSYIGSQRASQNRSIPQELVLSEIEIIGVERIEKYIDGTDLPISKITCVIDASVGGSVERIEFDVTVNDILEFAAHSLEEKLNIKLGNVTPAAPFDPYELVSVVAKHVAPTLDGEMTLMCALASLQDSDPPSVLIDRMTSLEKAVQAGVNPRNWIDENQRKLLMESKQWVEDTLDAIDGAFPRDEYLARAVKGTTSIMRTNFSRRIESPLYELDLATEIASGQVSLSEIIERHGACAVIPQRDGEVDSIERDLMYDIDKTSCGDDLLSRGRRIMHATFRFIARHVTPDGLVSTRDIPENNRNCCPFYTACTYEFRIDHPNDCKNRPWKSLDYMENPCWYSHAVYVLRPPESHRV